MSAPLAAYVALAAKSLRRAVAYRGALWTELAVNLLFMYLYLCLWQALMRGRDAVEGYTMSAMLTYVIMAQTVMTLQFTARIVWEIEARVRSGAIAIDLVRPIDFPASMLAIASGPALYTLALVMAPKVILFAAAGVLDAPPSVGAAAAFGLSVVFAFLVQFALELLVGLTAFWLLEIRGVYALVMWGMSALCSGYFLPLELYPEWAASICRVLPFQAIVYTPAAIWAGRLAGSDAAIALAIQAAWVIALLIGARVVFAAARRRLIVQGG